jgi:hypothetical protein
MPAFQTFLFHNLCQFKLGFIAVVSWGYLDF